MKERTTVSSDRITADQALANLTRLSTYLEEQSNRANLPMASSFITHTFTHKSHFWNTTYKPYPGRPKEHLL